MRTVPASAGQRVMWLMDHYRAHQGALASHVLLRLRGALDLGALQGALDHLVCTHDALRTTVHRRGREVEQRVHDELPVWLRAVDPSDGDQALVDLLRTDIDVSCCPVDATVFRYGHEDHVLCLRVHHLLTDAWSSSVLTADLCEAYEALCRGAAPQASPPQCQYPDHVLRQRDRLGRPDALRPHTRYWREHLRGAVPACLGPRNGPTGGVNDVFSFAIDEAISARLRRVAAERGAPIFPAMLAVFCAVLAEITGTGDVTVSSFVANRPSSDVRRTVGFFSNLVALRVNLAESARFSDVVDTSVASFLGAMRHQEIPLHTLPLNGLDGFRLGTPKVMFHMLPPESGNLESGPLDVERLPTPPGLGVRFGIEFLLRGDESRLTGTVRYPADDFTRDWVEGLVDRFLQLTDIYSTDPSAPVPVPPMACD